MRISVGKNVQVSAAHPDLTHDEVLLSASPTDPNLLIACPFLDDVGRLDHLELIPVDVGDPVRAVADMASDRGRGDVGSAG